MKLLSGLLTTFLLALGLTLVSSPAEAVYPKTVNTKCHAEAVDSVITTTQSARFRYWARASTGNGTPTGTVSIRVINKETGAEVKNLDKSYNGGTVTWSVGRIARPGSYSVRFYLRTGPSSVFKNCGTAASLRVTR
jgi:hypothetical protein